MSRTPTGSPQDAALLDARVPRRLEDFVAPETTALVMWDMQKGLAGRSPTRDAMVASARMLVEAADRAGVVVVWSRHVFPPMAYMSGPWLLWMMKRQGVESPSKVTPMFQAGSEDVEFLPELRPSPSHLVIDKHQPSFFFETPLDSRLKVRGIRTLVFAGFATDIGVEFSARHATALGYFAIIAEDAVSAYTAEAHDRSIAFLKSFVQVVPASPVIAAWTEASGRDRKR